MSQKSGFEIERKFLIAMPSAELLLAQNGTTVWKIEQTYLKNGGRVRKIVCDNKDTYIKTVKQHITDVKRIEKEWEITKEQYENELLGKADDRVTIEKTRYRIPFKGQILEVDIFPFYTDRAFLEIELEKEDSAFVIPDFINVIKEITADRRYRNSALAKQIVYEDLSNE